MAILAFDMSQVVGMTSIFKSRILSSLIIDTVRIVFYGDAEVHRSAIVRLVCAYLVITDGLFSEYE